jgi:nucleoside-diphosphate-sugar epimerase
MAPTGYVYIWVDVRDVALAHVRAIEVPEAGGQRFFVTAGHFANYDLVNLVRELHPELEAKLPPKEASSDLPSDIYGYDNKKSVKVLGIKYRSLKESVADTVKSLLAIGA